MPGSVRSRDERRQAVIEAAAALLRSANFEWFRGLTYDHLEADTGIDRGQIARDFGNKEALISALIDHCCTPAEGDQEFSHAIVDAATALNEDSSIDYATMVQRLGDLDEQRSSADRRLFNQMSMWALAQEDDAVRSRVRDLYNVYQEQYETMFDGFVDVAAERGLGRREGMTTSELVVLGTAMLEGLAIRAAFDPDAVTPGLAGRALIALTEAAIGEVDPDGEVPTLGDVLRQPPISE